MAFEESKDSDARLAAKMQAAEFVQAQAQADSTAIDLDEEDEFLLKPNRAKKAASASEKKSSGKSKSKAAKNSGDKNEKEAEKENDEQGAPKIQWSSDQVATLFEISNSEKYREKIRASSSYGLETHKEMFTEIGAAVGYTAKQAQRKFENIYSAMRKYHQRKRQTGASGESVRAGQGVLDMEGLLRKDRPKISPAVIADSADKVAEANKDAGSSSSGGGGSSGSNANLKAEDSKDKKSAAPNPNAPAPPLRPPGVSRKRVRDANEPAPKRTSSVKASTDRMIEFFEAQAEERRAEFERAQAEQAAHNKKLEDGQMRMAEEMRRFNDFLANQSASAASAAASAVPAPRSVDQPALPTAADVVKALAALSPADKEAVKAALATL